MAENSKIEWTDHTVNLWWGCSKVHTGCKNCYAENLSNRFGDNVWGEKVQRKLIKSATKDLNKYQKRAEKENKLVKVFIGSMMDIFEDSKSIIGLREQYVNTGTLRDNLFAEISEGKYQNLIFLFLTKRPENISDYVPHKWIADPPPNNVWIGCSISNEKTHCEMRKGILDSGWYGNIFYSIEPQIEEINNLDLRHVDWIIQGGESGNKKRPFDINWGYKMKQICKEQKTPFFFKQIDKAQEIPNDLMIREFPNLGSVGKNILELEPKISNEVHK